MTLDEIQKEVSKALQRAINKSTKVSSKEEAFKFADYCEKTRDRLFNKYAHLLDNRIQNIEYRFKDFIEDIDYLYVIINKTYERVWKKIS